MITWTKKLELLDERPLPLDYKESRTEGIRNNNIKTINFL
jgi:hypothetical protein